MAGTALVLIHILPTRSTLEPPAPSRPPVNAAAFSLSDAGARGSITPMNHHSKIARLEKQLAQAIAAKVKADAKRFKQLVLEWGYAGENEFLELVYGYPRTPRSGKPAKKPAVAKAGKRRRAVIDARKRDAIVADAKSGQLTGGQIARKHGVSLPSVQNIKKAAGLTRKS